MTNLRLVVFGHLKGERETNAPALEVRGLRPVSTRQRSLPHAVTFGHGEHAGQGRLESFEEREKILSRFLRRGWSKAEVDDAFGRLRASKVEQTTVIPVEGEQDTSLSKGAIQDGFV
ncbi:MAG: hypothetical protein AVDCRST_MAG78-382 [uncultured Rubrobacteraceae bacterium]|uniref:Uncharacterized protein n=1 Tax=uncultured Rubrobacteraceae bacterium TaxID=349277 RepID=A0A6J4PAC1_9ACTN|nr:MAG: hypothetical protein AVDCRST_MAG78-382 [uncultured Rubrobacteraceae bacterium]